MSLIVPKRVAHVDVLIRISRACICIGLFVSEEEDQSLKLALGSHGYEVLATSLS